MQTLSVHVIHQVFGIPALFSSKEKKLFVMYIINE